MKSIRISLILSLGLSLSACSLLPKEPVDTPKEEETTEISDADKLAELQAQWDSVDAQRRLDLGEFYVPLPPVNDTKSLRTETVKALYVTFNIAGFPFNEDDINYYAQVITDQANGQVPDLSREGDVNKLEQILAIVKATEINSLVIDVKDDRGWVGWPSDIAVVHNVGADQTIPWQDPQILMDYLKKENIYTIARIVAFKDPTFSVNQPDHSIQLSSGGVYTDKSGFTWVNPFDEYVWNYQIAVAQEAALRGFDEIQYDYVRFPDNAKYYNPITTFPGRNDRDKDEAIEQFLQKAKAALEPYKVHLSADVFGVITHSWDDQPDDIGQTWIKIAPTVDYVSPMVYPSHYGKGFYGFDVPDAHPYEVVKDALQDAIERNAALTNPAIIRPWLQGFTASWVKGYITYDETAIQDQILAAKALGIDQYIIWQSSNIYFPLSYVYDKRPVPTLKADTDLMERTPEEALRRYLDAQIYGRSSYLYLLTPIALRSADYDTYVTESTAKHLKLNKYEVLSINPVENGFEASVNASYVSDDGKANVEAGLYRIQLENGIYKITMPELSFVSE